MLYLNPVTEYTQAISWIEPLVGKEVTPRSLAKRLSSFLNKKHSIRVRAIEADEQYLDEDDFSIGAEYDPDLDQNYKKQIIINLIINHPKKVPWLITQDIADRFVLELVEALVHEYQHQHQYRSRRYKLHKEHFVSEQVDEKLRDEQEYFGNPDEIDAYAANIAARLYLLGHMLNTDIVETEWEANSLDLRNYINAFGSQHTVVIQLLDLIRTNIQHLKDVDNGKAKRKSSTRPRLRRPV